MRPTMTVLLIVSLLAVVAGARPEYAAAENLDCVECHESPRGGGPLNPRGGLYMSNGLSFTGVDPAGVEVEQPPIGSSPLWLFKSLLALLLMLTALGAVIVIYASRPAARREPEHGKKLRRAHHVYGWITLGLYLALTVICLLAHEVRGNTARVLWHSIIGFFGLALFALKLLIVRRRWKLWRVCHYVGGTLLAANLFMVLSSAWWYLIGRFA